MSKDVLVIGGGNQKLYNPRNRFFEAGGHLKSDYGEKQNWSETSFWTDLYTVLETGNYHFNAITIDFGSASWMNKIKDKPKFLEIFVNICTNFLNENGIIILEWFTEQETLTLINTEMLKIFHRSGIVKIDDIMFLIYSKVDSIDKTILYPNTEDIFTKKNKFEIGFIKNIKSGRDYSISLVNEAYNQLRFPSVKDATKLAEFIQKRVVKNVYKISSLTITEWVNEMCNKVDLEKLDNLPTNFRMALYKILQEFLEKDVTKKWLVKIIIDFMHILYFEKKSQLHINLKKCNKGENVEITKDLVLYQNLVRFRRKNVDSTLKMLDMFKFNMPITLFFNTSFEKIGKIVNNINSRCKSLPFKWFFNGILQYKNEITDYLLEINKLNENLQGGISDDPKIVHYIAKNSLNKSNFFISNVLTYGVYEIISVFVALHTLKIGGNLLMKIEPIFTPFKMKLVYMISECFESFELTNVKDETDGFQEVFIIGKDCKPIADRKNLITQLTKIIDERQLEMELDSLIPEEMYAVLQYFTYFLYKDN